MSAAADWFIQPLQYAFMRRALLEVIVMGSVTGAVGCFVVLRRLSFLGDALTHAVFPGIVIAFMLSQSIFLGALGFGTLTAVLIAIVSRNRRVGEDVAIGILFAAMFALGVVLISATRNFTRDLASFLFGNVLGVTPVDIGLSVGVGALVLVLMALFYKELLMTAFDRAAADAMGLPVFWLDLLLLLLITLTIVVSLSAVGNILVLAMLVTPAATARLLTDRLPVMIALSAGIGAASGVLGLLLSYHHDVAAGGTIVLVATGLFGVAWLLAPEHGLITTRLARRRPSAPEVRAP